MATLKHPKVGDLRPTQLIFTYGVGAIIDLPYFSALVMGLDDWAADQGVAREINEARLLQAVSWVLGGQVKQLLAPPAEPDRAGIPNPFDELARIGVPVATFPRWMLCPRCQLLAPLSTNLFERKDDPYHPERTRYVHVNCQKATNPPPVVPARFLVACEQGHLDDFPWIEFVHRGPTNCHAILRLIEFGPSGEARDLEVRCETCDNHRRLSDAFGKAGRARMPQCRGRRPHLRDYEDKGCPLPAKAILLGASNLWFADVLTALAIPTESGRLAQLVEDQWVVLKQLQTLQNVSLLRQLNQLAVFYGYSDAEIWQAIEDKRRQAQSADETGPTDLKQPEWDLLTHPQAQPATEDFQLRQVGIPPIFDDVFDKVVLVERMREVRALVGFTRIDAPGEYGVDRQSATDNRMRLSRRDPAWVPAAEVRGEGIFIQFAEAQLQQWLSQAPVKLWDEVFMESHISWRRVRHVEPEDGNYPGLRYILLHTVAHALMRQLVLECGYSSASVRERIYARNPGGNPDYPEPMAGVLIYTAAPDSEGTLGGLVSLGRPEELERHMRAALRDAALCASDPLCAEHQPSHQGITLHGAACHACLFSPETSCERGNRYLDRSLLVPTVEKEDLAFFSRIRNRA